MNNLSALSTNTSNNCWLRQIEVRLFSKLYNVKPLIFGTNAIKSFKFTDEDPNDNNNIITSVNGNYILETKAIADQLNIDIKINKKISALEDNGTVDISNLTYSTIAQIILGEYYGIEIWLGYKTQGLQCYFSGEIAFISNEIAMRRDHTCHIIFASKFVASYSQKRINLNLNSGINLYSAMKYICLTAGIDSSHLSESLKSEFLNEVTANWGTPATLAETLAKNTANYTISADASIDGNIVDCSRLDDKRQIRISPETISFRKGNPTVTKDGLNISLLPTFNFKTGDIIIIDNSIINISVNSLSQAQSAFNENYLDRTFQNTETPQLGAYMIHEITGVFQNRGESFELNIIARAVSIIVSTLGINY